MSREPQGDGAAPAGVDGSMARVPARVVTGATDPHMRDHRSQRHAVEEGNRTMSEGFVRDRLDVERDDLDLKQRLGALLGHVKQLVRILLGQQFLLVVRADLAPDLTPETR